MFVGLWKLWLERNSCVFSNQSTVLDKVVESIIWTVSGWGHVEVESSWMSLCKPYLLSWDACFQGGRLVKPVQKSSWMNPLDGLMKLNFDGSYIKEARRGGFSGVISDSSSKNLCSYLGVVQCIDSNGAEVYANANGMS